MDNFALQRGPIPVLSTERSPPNLTAALTRLRRSFLGSPLDILGRRQKPSANRSDQFQSFSACQLQAEACRPFSGLRSARRRPAIVAQRRGRLPPPSRPDRPRLASLRTCIFRSGFANGYRNRVPPQANSLARNLRKQKTLACQWYARCAVSIDAFLITQLPAGGTGSPAPSAAGVPTVREWNERPGHLVVIGGGWRRIKSRHVSLLRSGLDRRSHGVQQSVEFSFAHRALQVRARSVSEVPYFGVEQVAPIVSNRCSRPTWLMIPCPSR